MNWENYQGVIVDSISLLRDFISLDASNPQLCDKLFQHYGPGNLYSTIPNTMPILTPFEKFSQYEQILLELASQDEQKYRLIHKGTPFYFMSWLAFTMEDYERAMFYMDAAVGEDMRLVQNTSDPNGWLNKPAASFLLLDVQNTGPGQVITTRLLQMLDGEISRLNAKTGAQLSWSSFRDLFIRPNLTKLEFRSVVSGLYIFILEFDKRKNELHVKSNRGGSIEPLLLHLFSGGLIYESLLKTSYPGNSLGEYLTDTRALLELNINNPNYPTPLYKRDRPGSGYTLPLLIQKLSSWDQEDYHQKIVAVSYAVRNTAGHDLSWPDMFTPEIYKKLYESIIEAILWYIWKNRVSNP